MDVCLSQMAALVTGSFVVTAVVAWVNFGTPRISYGGYQIGLAFYKAVLQGFEGYGSRRTR